MDTKTITEKSHLLLKAAAANEPPSTLLSILRDLQQNVKPTEDILRSTKIGVTVNRLKQNKSAEVARLAGEVVSKWRAEVTKQNGKKASMSSPAASKTPPPPSQESKSSVPPDKRSWKADDVDTNRTGQKTRDSCIGLMYDALALNSTEPPSLVIAKAVAIEKAALEDYGPETKPGYREKMRSLFQNLKNKSNPGLRVAVLGGDITPERFVKMTHEELRSDSRKAEDAKLEKENMAKAMVPQAERSVSTSLQCGKCKQKKVSYSQAQTRSADEPMTTFCECTVCGEYHPSSHAFTKLPHKFCTLTQPGRQPLEILVRDSRAPLGLNERSRDFPGFYAT